MFLSPRGGRSLLAVTSVVGLLGLAACASGGADASSGPEGPQPIPEASADGFDLDALIAAAQEEGPITIYDNASAVEDMAEAFTEKYGIPATGVKADAAEATEMVMREAQAGNVVGDVVAIADIPALTAQLVPEGFVTSWLPGDLAADIDPSMQDPLVMISDPTFWTYNDEVYDSCPVSNIWELTDPEWTGSVALDDPVGANKILDWFSQMDQFADEELRTAYEEYAGEELPADVTSATREWVARLAANEPILTGSNEDVSAAVGAPGQSRPPMGLVASSKFRNIDEKGYAHAVCEDLTPWVGIAPPKGLVVAAQSENPNAARLYVHFALTEEGIAPQINDGKISSNSSLAQPEDPSGVRDHLGELFYSDNAGVETDWQQRQELQDLWRTSSR